MYIIYMGICSGITKKDIQCKRKGLFMDYNSKPQGLEYCHQHVPKCVNMCVICMMPLYDKTITPCSHVFHKRCLQKWLKIKKSCPVCRSQIVKPIPFGGIISKINVDSTDFACACDIALQCDSIENFVLRLEEILHLDVNTFNTN